MARRILFLDIDGVLNCNSTKEKITVPLGEFTGIDKKLLSRLLNWLGAHPEVEVVLSSTWRTDERFTDHLIEQGLSWVSVTPNFGHRGNEIKQWLSDNAKGSDVFIAILDDISANMDPMRRFLVQTSDFSGGLKDKHLRMVEKLLGYEPSK